MANFFKESIAELEHVVWPTHIETKNFFKVVVAIIVGMTIFTYLLTLLFSNSLFGLRTWMHTSPTADLSGSPTVSGEIQTITTEWGQTIQVTPTPVETTPTPVQ
jgi:preprotein translocase SecE subunit